MTEDQVRSNCILLSKQCNKYTTQKDRVASFYWLIIGIGLLAIKTPMHSHPDLINWYDNFAYIVAFETIEQQPGPDEPDESTPQSTGQDVV